MSDVATYPQTGLVAARESSRATMAARVISDICSPVALAVPCLMLAVWTSGAAETIWYALLYAAIAIPLPVLYTVWLVKSGRVADFHLPDRRDRVGPFAMSLTCALGAIAMLVYAGAPSAFVAPISAVFLQTFALFLITLVWQISVHTATTAGFATFAVLALGSEAALLGVLVALVAWARIHLGRHTPAQTVAGTLLGCATFLVLFALRGIVW